MYKMICLDCGCIFENNKSDRTIYCPECDRSHTVSKFIHDRKVNFEFELKELRKNGIIIYES